MNAKLLERIIIFRFKFGIDTVKQIIEQKIHYQCSIVRQSAKGKLFCKKLESVSNPKEIFIIEALSARFYWSKYYQLLGSRFVWNGRSPHNHDPINNLLDIGYHFLVNELSKIFKDADIPYEIGLLHKAQSKNAKPLVYDFMEWLRPVVVDRVVLSFLHKKKKTDIILNKKVVGKFIVLLKREFDRLYFNKELGYCVTLKFWTRLNVLHLITAINHGHAIQWHFPSLRHETRCKTTKPRSI
jgi:CRISPR-associated endonuclease Cas1